MHLLTHDSSGNKSWNKGRLTGQKPPLKLKEIWAIRIRLQMKGRIRDVMYGASIVTRAMILQRKTTARSV
jgi:hypothetical protein